MEDDITLGTVIKNLFLWGLGLGIPLIVVLFILHVVSVPIGIASRTFNADNIIHNYEWFHDSDNAIRARVAQINAHKKLYDTETDVTERQRLRIELGAMQQTCRDLSAQYNANADKVNRDLFRMGTPASEPISACEGN